MPFSTRKKTIAFGASIAVLGLASILQGLYFNDKDRNQESCFSRSFHDLTEVLDRRAENGTESNRILVRRLDLIGEKTDLNNEQLTNLVEALITSSTKVQTPAERDKLVKEFLADTEMFKKRAAEIQKENAKLQQDTRDVVDKQSRTKIPPFPEGKCD